MNEFMTNMEQGAALYHEYFIALLGAGFNEPQALYLLATMATGSPGHPPTGEPAPPPEV